MELNITEIKPKENTVVLSIEGRLNVITAGELKNKIKQHINEKSIHLILDCAGVTFIDSSGLSAFVSGLKSTREQGGSLKLVGLTDQVKRVFELTRLSRIFEFYTDVEQALSAE